MEHKSLNFSGTSIPGDQVVNTPDLQASANLCCQQLLCTQIHFVSASQAHHWPCLPRWSGNGVLKCRREQDCRCGVHEGAVGIKAS